MKRAAVAEHPGRTAGAVPVLFDPFAPGFTDDPYPHYAELRTAAPVYEHPLGFWVLSDYDSVSALLRSGASVSDRHRADSPILEITKAAYGERPLTINQSMLDLDPPGHTRLRRLVTKAFTPRAVERLRTRIEALTDAALDRIAAAGRPDLIAELAFPLPFAVISEMLGMPSVDHARLRDLTGLLVRSLEPIVDPQLAAAIAAADQQIAAIAKDVIDRKRAEPGPDLLTALISAEHEGDILSDEELAAQMLLLYIAGHETTVNLIGAGIVALLREPSQLRLLSTREDLGTNAVEELLRYTSPVQMSRRVIAREPYRAGNREIPPGAFVIASIASANRDREFWGPEADDLRLDRTDAHKHLSFGLGIHHCLGAALARLEGQIAITRLARRFQDLTLQEVAWNGRINFRGPAKLVVSPHA
jgi:cytochrome P450